MKGLTLSLVLAAVAALSALPLAAPVHAQGELVIGESIPLLSIRRLSVAAQGGIAQTAEDLFGASRVTNGRVFGIGAAYNLTRGSRERNYLGHTSLAGGVEKMVGPPGGDLWRSRLVLSIALYAGR